VQQNSAQNLALLRKYIFAVRRGVNLIWQTLGLLLPAKSHMEADTWHEVSMTVQLIRYY
jgi:hypothetical protein